MQTGSFAEAANGTIRIGGFETVIKAAGGRTDGAVTVVEHTLGPGLLGAPLHRHMREDEISCVLEGELTLQLGGDVMTAGPGETVVKPKGQFHTFWNATATPVRFLEVIVPGGFEEYLAELATIIPAEGAPDMAALCALGARHGLEFDLAGTPALLERHSLALA